MEHINFELAKSEGFLTEAVKNLPVGVAYFLLKAKTSELESLYYEQVQKEYQEEQQAAMEQEEKENKEEQISIEAIEE